MHLLVILQNVVTSPVKGKREGEVINKKKSKFRDVFVIKNLRTY